MDDEFADVVLAEADGLARLAFLLCGDAALAEDAVVEAVAGVLGRLRRAPVDDVRSYLGRAVVNQVRRSGRQTARRDVREQRRSGDARGQRAHEDDVVERDEVRRLLVELTPRQREAIVLATTATCPRPLRPPRWTAPLALSRA